MAETGEEDARGARMRALFGASREGSWRVPYERTFQALVGMDLDVDEHDAVVARVPVGDHLKQPMGIVHGGVYAAIAETIASIATARDVLGEGKLALGQSNNTSFFRPVTEGTIRATGTRRHRGRTSQVWQIDMFDDAGRLAATSTVTIAVRAPERG